MRATIRQRLDRLLRLGVVSLLAFVIMPARSANASISVSTCNPADLILAINTANSTLADDTIELNGSCIYSLTAVDNSADGSNGLPSVVSATTGGALIINGNGATIERSEALGTAEFRIFHVANDGNLTLNDVTVSNGIASGFSNVGTEDDGGGIFNWGALVIDNSTISGNSPPSCSRCS